MMLYRPIFQPGKLFPSDNDGIIINYMCIYIVTLQ